MENMTANFRKMLKDHKVEDIDIILDVGTRDAKQSIEFFAHYPKAKIYSFEANSDTYKRALANTQHTNNIEVFNLAIADYDGEIPFYKVKPPKEGVSSVTGIPMDLNYEELKVPCMRLDTWAKNVGVSKIDIIWADLQGAELKMLLGLGDLLKTVKAFQVEVIYFHNHFKGCNSYRDIVDFCEDNSFKCVSNIHHEGNPYGGDAVFVRSAYLENYRY